MEILLGSAVLLEVQMAMATWPGNFFSIHSCFGNWIFPRKEPSLALVIYAVTDLLYILFSFKTGLPKYVLCEAAMKDILDCLGRECRRLPMETWQMQHVTLKL